MMRTLAQTGNGWMTFKDASNAKCNQTGFRAAAGEGLGDAVRDSLAERLGGDDELAGHDLKEVLRLSSEGRRAAGGFRTARGSRVASGRSMC